MHIHERHERIYATIASIPQGFVASYGDVAEAAHIARGARQVAQALRRLPKGSKLAWHRVVRATGQIAPRPGPGFASQVARLRREGVEVSQSGRVQMSLYRWNRW